MIGRVKSNPVGKAFGAEEKEDSGVSFTMLQSQI
jgi:hypothetical protein